MEIGLQRGSNRRSLSPARVRALKLIAACTIAIVAAKVTPIGVARAVEAALVIYGLSMIDDDVIAAIKSCLRPFDYLVIGIAGLSAMLPILFRIVSPESFLLTQELRMFMAGMWLLIGGTAFVRVLWHSNHQPGGQE